MAGTRSESATISALLQRGHDPSPIPETYEPVATVPMVAVLYNDAPWRGPVGMWELNEEAFRYFAIRTLADHIGYAAGQPPVAIMAVLDTMPGDYISLLDDAFGWMILGDMVADRLGIFDPAKPLLSYPLH
jgi:hypothetical protein